MLITLKSVFDMTLEYNIISSSTIYIYAMTMLISVERVGWHRDVLNARVSIWKFS